MKTTILALLILSLTAALLITDSNINIRIGSDPTSIRFSDEPGEPTQKT